MAKRRRKKPNIPQSVIDEARQENADGGSASTAAPAKAKAEKTSSETPKARRSRRRDIQGGATLEKRKDSDSLTGDYIAEMIANPTKVVTEEDLRADYGFVIKDLRNMGILAAVLFVCLIGIAVVFL